jgi:hypothetical protein
MKRLLHLHFWLFVTHIVFSQINIKVTNFEAYQILTGDYDPESYMSTNPINSHNDIIAGIYSDVSSDSLKSYILKLAMFENRNTGSDTISKHRGIGLQENGFYQNSMK